VLKETEREMYGQRNDRSQSREEYVILVTSAVILPIPFIACVKLKCLYWYYLDNKRFHFFIFCMQFTTIQGVS